MKAHKQNAATEIRRQEIEKQFQANKAVILKDVESLELSVAELIKKYSITERTLRRWLERLGIDPMERTLARRKAGFEKKAVRPIVNSKTLRDDVPQAHKLVGLW